MSSSASYKSPAKKVRRSERRPAAYWRAAQEYHTHARAYAKLYAPAVRAQDDIVWGRLEVRLSKEDVELKSFDLKGDKAQIVGRAMGSDVTIPLPHVSVARRG